MSKSNNGNITTATKWLFDITSTAKKSPIKSTFMVVSRKTNKKGTAFSLTTGYLITNEHVVRNSSSDDLMVISSTGEKLSVSKIKASKDYDLAVLTMKKETNFGYLIQKKLPEIGDKVYTWGYPLAYNGPSPILSVGYLAGFNPHQRTSSSPVVKHYVVNGAFNPGNSGGPLIASQENAIIGVVVSKHAPITQWHLSALEALKNQKSGFIYTATDSQGGKHRFSEGQLVGDLLQYFRQMTQVVIGEAITSEELIKFLSSHKIEYETS